MKNLILVFAVLFLFQSAFAQTVKEKKLFEGKDIETYSLYDFRFDEKSGTYVYSKSDTITYKTKLISNKGNSDEYNNIGSYYAQFDNSGNYYVSGSNTLANNANQYFFLRNGVKLKTFENINEPISKNGNNIILSRARTARIFW